MNGKNTDLNYATFSHRLLAHNIDLLVLIPVFYGMSALISSNTYFYPLAAATYFVYHVATELGGWNGTIGKRLLKIEIKNIDLNPPGFAQILIRNLAKFLSFALFFVGFAMISFNPKKQGLHDKLSNCILLKRR